jgi:hypothetical protein
VFPINRGAVQSRRKFQENAQLQIINVLWDQTQECEKSGDVILREMSEIPEHQCFNELGGVEDSGAM